MPNQYASTNGSQRHAGCWRTRRATVSRGKSLRSHLPEVMAKERE